MESPGTPGRFKASVEQFFLTRLIEDLGYEDAQIKPKTSLQGEQAAAIDRLTAAFELGSDEALRIIEAFKPPR